MRRWVNAASVRYRYVGIANWASVGAIRRRRVFLEKRRLGPQLDITRQGIPTSVARGVGTRGLR